MWGGVEEVFMKWMVLLLFGGLGLGILVGGLIWVAKRYEISTNGVHAQGTVVENYKSISTNSEDSDRRSRSSGAYYPVVEFQTEEGKKIRFQGSTGSGTPEFEVGTPVKVVYKPQNPHEAQLVNFTQMWLGPVVITIAGFIFFSMGVGSFFIMGAGDASQKNSQRQFLSMRPDSVKINGTIREVKTKGRDKYVFVCTAVRPGGSMEEEFETDFFTFDPGSEFVGRSVTVCLDPLDRESYYIEFGPLLKEIVKKQAR
jgi:hypothetical protein